MFRQISKFLIIIMVAGLMLAACGGGAPDANNSGNTAANNDSSNASNSGAEDSSSSDDASDSTNDTADAGSTDVMEMDAVLAAGAVLDPALAAEDDTAVLEVSSYIYDTLVSYNGSDVAEGLAIEWSVSDDGLTYEFRLRANGVFSDGTPVNTDIVVENFSRWFDPEHALHGDSAGYQAWVQYFDDFLVKDLAEDEAPPSKFDGIEKVDNLVFLLHLNEQMDDFLEILAMPQFSILNPEALAASGYGTSASSVIGTGAYVVDIWGDDSLVLVPHTAYWGNADANSMIVFSVK